MGKRVTCPKPGCPIDPKAIAKTGFFWRQDDSRRIQRYRCRTCGRNFSAATFSDAYWQKRRRINRRLWWLLNLKVNRNAAATCLNINRKSVDYRIDWFGALGRRYLDGLKDRGLVHIQFDEMQSSIHTKCKPVAIPIVVDAGTRKILALGVASMPAQPPLVAIALKRYGPRRDDRVPAIGVVLDKVRPMLAANAQITTDCALHYPGPIIRHLPNVRHVRVRSRRARSVGQGELKRGGFDPIFSFNHTAAMFRDRVSRLVRRTWANSKRQDRLESHLYIYAHFHNTVLLKPQTRA